MDDPTTPKLYVVTTGLPGPGVLALIKDELGASGWDELSTFAREAIQRAAAKACEFVELEDSHGRGVGDSGVRWEAPFSFFGRRERVTLGPFVAARDYADLVAELPPSWSQATTEPDHG